jgi:hypothetical protein
MKPKFASPTKKVKAEPPEENGTVNILFIGSVSFS